MNREFDIISGRHARHNISLLALDHVADALHGLRRVEQNLGQREMMGKLLNVVWYYDI